MPETTTIEQHPKYEIFEITCYVDEINVRLRRDDHDAPSDWASPIQMRLWFDPYYMWDKNTLLAQKRKVYSELLIAAERIGWYTQEDIDEMLTGTWDDLRSRVWERMLHVWPACPVCDVMHSSGPPQAQECDSPHCSTMVCNQTRMTLRLRDTGENLCHLCTTCYETNWRDIGVLFPRATNCQGCSRIVSAGSMRQHEGEEFCERCFQNLPICAVCDHVVPNREGFTHRSFGSVHNACRDNLPPIGTVRSWDYRPTPVFYPDLPADPTQPLYVGMELEVSRPHNSREMKSMMWLGKLDDRFYAKYDGSVNNGFEVVTHPIQPLHALETFPFDHFDEAIADGILMSEHESCGTHMHMNKDAFVPAHMWKFLQLHFRMPMFCQMVGGRSNNHWAKFRSAANDDLRADIINIAKKKGRANYDRYVAVNLRNEYTVELRYPKGGIKSTEIRKNYEWAHASYSFTNQLAISDINQGALDEARPLTKYIKDSPLYPNLNDWIEQAQSRGQTWEVK